MGMVLFLERMARRRRQAGKGGLWTAVALTAYLFRQYDRHVRHKVDVLREDLKPGETLLITHTTEPRG